MTNIPDLNTKYQGCIEYLEVIRRILWDEVQKTEL